MTLVTQSGEKRVAPTPAAQRTNAFTRYATRIEGSDVTATIFNRPCQDTMTGMPHPYAVEVVLDGKKLTGCGGDPATLLQGREWVVEDINGKGIIDRSRATLNFGADGRVSGRSSCNNYTAQYTLTGEGLTVSKAAGTMMACEPALMQQEQLVPRRAAERAPLRPRPGRRAHSPDRRPPDDHGAALSVVPARRGRAEVQQSVARVNTPSGASFFRWHGASCAGTGGHDVDVDRQGSGRVRARAAQRRRVAEADPPARVGRASLVEGDVAYQRDGEWVPLPVNWPITTGARLSAAPGARAEVRVGSTAVRLAGATELEVVRLDDDAIALRLLHGTIDARVRDGEVAREFSVETPEARATLLEPGRYRFDAGIVPDTTAVSADIGAARVEAGGNSIVVRPGKRAEVWRNGDVLLADARPDAFDEWALARDRREEASRTARYVSPEMTGYESLAEHGDWREVPEYGPVWVPRAVPVGWAPYRTGRWAWVEPWGWTWIDEAPWGFAPFHYGRWAFVGGVWAWAPGRVIARPVYAPALVGWVGRPGWSVSVSIGTVPAVGWFPLAPREVFVPAYRHSPAYVRNVNIAHVTNVTQITNVTVTNVNYVNRRIDRAVTVVPGGSGHQRTADRAFAGARAPGRARPQRAGIADAAGGRDRPAAAGGAARGARRSRAAAAVRPGPALAGGAARRTARRTQAGGAHAAVAERGRDTERAGSRRSPRRRDREGASERSIDRRRASMNGPQRAAARGRARPDPRSEPPRPGQRVETAPRDRAGRADAFADPSATAQRAAHGRHAAGAAARGAARRAPRAQSRRRRRPLRPKCGASRVRRTPAGAATGGPSRRAAACDRAGRADAPTPSPKRAAPPEPPSRTSVASSRRVRSRRRRPLRSQQRPRPSRTPRAPMPPVRAAPPAPQPQQQQSAPRGDRDRGQGREQRRGEGRNTG